MFAYFIKEIEICELFALNEIVKLIEFLDFLGIN